MNQYSQLLNYIKQLGESDPFVNTVEQGEVNEAFFDKGIIYPLLHIAVNTGSFTNGQTIIFNVELTCVQQRDTNKEIINDRFYKNDNEIDNFNETLAVLNRIWTTMYKDFCDKNITSSENASLEKVTDAFKDRLDGWQLIFDVELPNTEINICRDLEC
jgi:hypothetical protein